jgi:DNA polymerase-3 subunit delta
VFYILHGEEEFARSEALGQLRARFAGSDPAMTDLNTTVLNGAKLTLGELHHACDTIPFMAERRITIVHDLLSRLIAKGKGGTGKSDKAFLQDLVAYLPDLPPTTALIFVEAKALPSSHPVVKLALSQKGDGKEFVQQFKPTKAWDLPQWIRARVKKRGGRIEPQAVKLLAALVGTDLRLLDGEIEKLLLYADGQPIDDEAVLALVSLARETSIFDLVDCVGRREADRALKLLHRMLDEGAAPLYLLTMLARQIRILIQVSELQAQGLAQDQIAGELKLHPYVVKKGLAQAQNFDLDQLEAAHRHLVDTDLSIKTGRLPDVLALDMLVVALTND